MNIGVSILHAMLEENLEHRKVHQEACEVRVSYRIHIVLTEKVTPE